jgi:hypothetical protein
MSLGARTVAAVLLASLGTFAIYFGMFLNVAALGSTLGYITMVPGLLLLAAATLPLRGTPRSSFRYVGVAVLRYLSLPIFILGAAMLLISTPHISSVEGEVHGVGAALVVTAGGLIAILWPEISVLWHRVRGADA